MKTPRVRLYVKDALARIVELERQCTALMAHTRTLHESVTLSEKRLLALECPPVPRPWWKAPWGTTKPPPL